MRICKDIEMLLLLEIEGKCRHRRHKAAMRCPYRLNKDAKTCGKEEMKF
jgi:hypothetical protein